MFKQRLVHCSPTECKEAINHLKNLCMLYGLHLIHSDPLSCYECGYFEDAPRTPRFSFMIMESIKLLFKKIRPQAINIIESLEFFDDNVLCSAIGNSYGDIYETHLEWAKNSRLNHTKAGDAIPDGYMEYMMPILKGKL